MSSELFTVLMDMYIKNVSEGISGGMGDVWMYTFTFHFDEVMFLTENKNY